MKQKIREKRKQTRDDKLAIQKYEIKKIYHLDVVTEDVIRHLRDRKAKSRYFNKKYFDGTLEEAIVAEKNHVLDKYHNYDVFDVLTSPTRTLNFSLVLECLIFLGYTRVGDELLQDEGFYSKLYHHYKANKRRYEICSCISLNLTRDGTLTLDKDKKLNQRMGMYLSSRLQSVGLRLTETNNTSKMENGNKINLYYKTLELYDKDLYDLYLAPPLPIETPQ